MVNQTLALALALALRVLYRGDAEDAGELEASEHDRREDLG